MVPRRLSELMDGTIDVNVNKNLLDYDAITKTNTISPSVKELRKVFLKKIFFLIRPRKIKKEEENVQHEIDRLRHSVGLLRQRGRRTGSQRGKVIDH